jgi:hypothetical protein
MDVRSATRYVQYIATHAGIFLSINHEANSFTVADLGRRFLSSAEMHRAPYFMRNGYVEEVFRFGRDEPRS